MTHAFETLRPQVRTDLVFGPPMISGEKTVHYIKDLQLNQFYRVGEQEYFLMSRMNGQREVRELTAEYEAAFQARLSEKSWLQLFKLLGKRAFLADGTAPAQPAVVNNAVSKASATQKQHRSLRRMPLFQPERFLHALLPWLRFAFHPAFVYPALVAVVLLEVFCSIKAPAVLARFLPALQHNLSIPLILLFAALIYAFLLSHELAHGLACKYFGGSVPEIGITWRTFCPVIYCKIDDVVLFQSRWQRVYTAFAGLFTNLLMLLPFAIWWWLSPPASLAWVICTFVLLVINFLILLNAIPLGDFDGYLMLKYALNILDLREQALQMGIQAIKGISFKQVDKAHTHRSLKNRKEYIVYILLCVFSIVALLTYMVFLLLHL